MKKLIPILSLFLLVGCSGNTDSTSSSQPDYPNVYLQARATAKQVEIGASIQVRAIISTDGDKTCTFTSSDTSIATVTVEESGLKATLTGVKAGNVTVTITSNANPTISASVEITVIATRPSLRGAIKNIQELDNYTLIVSELESDGSVSSNTGAVYVTEDAIMYTDYYGSPIFKDDKKNNLYGEYVTKNGDVVYIAESNTNFITTGAQIVQSDAGLLTKDNFKGLKDKSNQAFQVGEFYSYDAINPSWVTDTKSSDNTYVIDGEAIDENKTATNINGAFLESLLWKLADPEGYEDYIGSNKINEFFYTVASQVTTTITVASSSTITVDVEKTDGTGFRISMQDVGETTLGDLDLDDVLTDSVTASTPVIGSNLEKGIAAVKSDNYIRENSMFPDHSTEIIYYTYFTPEYVFHDCNLEFRTKYNANLSSDTTEWTKIPYGYVKKADGIYKFTYDEDKDEVSVETTKQEGTDASSTVASFDGYFSTISTFASTSTLKYSFSSTEASIWNNHSTKYYETSSRTVFDEFINYYAPEDIEDVIENTKAGLGVVLADDGSVATVNGTLGFTPFTGSADKDITTHTYGVDYFSLSDFGNGTNNHVNTALQSYINK